MRRLRPVELERSPALPVGAPLERAERARAAAVMAQLQQFLEHELALSPGQRAALELALERALVLSLRAAP